MSGLWINQLRGVLRLELRKNLFSMRATPLYILASLPLIVVALFVIASSLTGIPDELKGPTAAATFFSYLFQFILRFVIYFGCVWMFMNLFRGEVLDRSLHYYFLAPIRREVLVAAKYVSAWATTVIVFCGTTGACFLVIHFFLGHGGGALLSGVTAGHLIAYLGVVLLACLGYGAVFLMIGLFFRNPIVPAVLIFLWEGANYLLPGLLKKLSVVFYLQSLFPVPLEEGPFALMVEPVSIWLGVPGLVLFTAAVLALAGMRIRHMEISYSTD